MKSKLVSMLLCLFLGNFGVHRFYLGKIGTGILYLFTCGFFGIGTFVDLIRIAANNMKDKSGCDLNEDVAPILSWLIVGIPIFIMIVGVFCGIFSVAKDVATGTPPTSIVETQPIPSQREPVVEKPVKKEPVKKEPIKEEPIKEEPVVEKEPIVEKPTVHYQAVTVKQLFDELEANALRAEKTYQDAYVAITGKLSTIDSDGSYITIIASNDEWGFESVHCSITDDSQMDKIINFNKGDKITVYGQITSIGEILGYSLDITDIE